MSTTRQPQVNVDDWKKYVRAGHFPDWLDQPVDVVAQRLLGCLLIRTLNVDNSPVRVIVRIVETEAYDQNDPASHAYHGKTHRNRALFGPAGRCYVYFTYGMYHCLNISASTDGFGAGALIRAVEPVDEASRKIVEERRKIHGVGATNGPAKLCMALGIDADLYGHDLRTAPLQLVEAPLRDGETVQKTVRIGISRARDVLRRFVIAGNPYVSKLPHHSHVSSSK
jgi:DNA-3-methyladenine glycosylase